jgi:curved DNA-binding protein
MEFKDYYSTLGLKRSATPEQIKRAYRRLARKYHPDVSKEADAEARFKEVAEAHEALHDPERRAAYDELDDRRRRGESFEPPTGWRTDFDGQRSAADAQAQAEHSAFFESLFGHVRSGRPGRRGMPRPGADHHAQVLIDLEDAYAGARQVISMSEPVLDAQGRRVMGERQLEVAIPAGVREGQRLRLAGQGARGEGGAAPGDLYLEIGLRPHPLFRVDGADVFVELPLTPWEAALGATVTARTPDGEVTLTIPPGSAPGRKLRLRGKGLPGSPAGDLYAVLGVALPPSASDADRQAWAALAQAFPDFKALGGARK